MEGYTAIEFADQIGVSIRTFWRRLAAGKLPQPVRQNRKLVRWPVDVVETFLARRRGEPDTFDDLADGYIDLREPTVETTTVEPAQIVAEPMFTRHMPDAYRNGHSRPAGRDDRQTIRRPTTRPRPRCRPA